MGVLLLVVPLASLGGHWSTGANVARSEAGTRRRETLVSERRVELERLYAGIRVLHNGERPGQQTTEQSQQTIRLLEDQVPKR